MDLAQHLATLERLLELERREEKARYESERSSLSFEGRQALGHALLDLKAADSRALAGRVLLELRPANPSRGLPSSLIGAGSLVRVLRRRAEPDEEPPSGVVSRLSRAGIFVAFDAPPPDWVESGQVCLELLPSEVTYERQRLGLARLARGDARHLERWRRLLVGERAPAFLPSKFEPSDELNPEQNEALQLALSAQDFALIHGPPGTGKTTVLAEVVERALANGERVLVSAASNMAVDNVLARLARPGLEAVRIGHVARVSEALLPWTLDEQVEANEVNIAGRELLDEAHELLARSKKLAARGRGADRYAESRQLRAEAGRLFSEARELLRGVRSRIVRDARVVFATCTGSMGEVLRDELFDLAVVDEATQATEPSALLPILHARRAILAGDHRQLPPTVLSPEAARAGLSRSLFERLLELHGSETARMLCEQHRMHESIMAFPSRALYEGQLRAHRAVARHLLSELPAVEATSLTTVPLVFLDTAGKGFDEELAEGSESRRNPQEAELVAAKVRELLAAGVRPAQISVIAPYEAQVQALRALLPQDELEVDTVDGFQGRENEAVVVSLTRSNSEGEVGFLADIRRMNVAITRARRHLLMVGDSATVSAHPFFKAFIEHATAVGGYRSAWDEES